MGIKLSKVFFYSFIKMNTQPQSQFRIDWLVHDLDILSCTLQ